MKRTGIRSMSAKRRKRLEGPTAQRERDPVALRPVERPCTYTGTTTGPAPKGEPYRDRALLDMARGRPCLLMVPGCCNRQWDTTVAAHSNLSIHGKAGARKADDCYTVAACHACHSWLDQGSASAEVKAARFMGGHALQVLAWSNIAAASDEPLRFRRAAQRALDRLGVRA